MNTTKMDLETWFRVYLLPVVVEVLAARLRTSIAKKDLLEMGISLREFYALDTRTKKWFYEGVWVYRQMTECKSYVTQVKITNHDIAWLLQMHSPMFIDVVCANINKFHPLTVKVTKDNITIWEIIDYIEFHSFLTLEEIFRIGDFPHRR